MDKGIDHMPYMSCLDQATLLDYLRKTDGAGRHTPHTLLFNARILIRDGHSPALRQGREQTANRLYV